MRGERALCISVLRAKRIPSRNLKNVIQWGLVLDSVAEAVGVSLLKFASRGGGGGMVGLYPA